MSEMEDKEELNQSDVSMDSDSDSDDDAQQEQLLNEASELKLQLKENPLYYDGHLKYISVLKQMGELEQLREARNAMSEIYPLTPQLWLEWVKDEQKICTTSEERACIIKLFQRAVLDYMSVKLWLEYVMFMLGGGDMDATRAVCNEALVAVGTHVSEGLLVWQTVLLFEQQVYATISSQLEDASDETNKQIKTQKQRIQNLYKRQFRVPLLNMDKTSLIEEASEWFEGELDTHMRNDLDKAIKKLQTKITFEESLLQVDEQTQKLVTYKLYLDHLKNLKENPVDVQSVYERAITDNALDTSLWEEYIQYMMEKFGNSDYLILPICERSLRNCPWAGNLVDLHISALQQCEETLQDSEDTVAVKIKGVLEKSLSSGVPLASEAIKMWMSYLVFLRRQIHWEEEDHTVALTLFRENCHRAIQALDQYYGQESVVDCSIPRFLAQIEAEFVKDIQAARDIWNNIILQRNNNYNNAYLWIEFINLERSYGSVKHCRKLFRRALERVWEGVEVISEAFNRFEQETGTFTTMSEFKTRLSERMVHVSKRNEELIKKEQAAKTHEGKYQQNKKEKFRDKFKGKKESQSKEFQNTQSKKYNKPTMESKTLQESSVKAKITSSSSSTSGFSDHSSSVAPPPGFTSDVAPPPGFASDVAPPPGFTSDVAPPPGYTEDSPKGKKRSADDESGNSFKKPKVNPNHGETITHDDSDDPYTVFVSNLDFKTTEEQVLDVVKNCGEIKSLRLAKDFKGRSKGFGYLTFVSQTSVSQALKLDRTRIAGRPMFISPCNTHSRGTQFKYSTALEKEKLFVRGLPKNLDETMIKEIFEKHGTVKELRLVTFRNGFSKGTCYITFDSEETAENVRQQMDGTELEGKKITVLISNPSKTGEKSKDLNLGEVSRKASSSTQHLSMKPKLAFVPRSIQQKSKASLVTENGTPKSNQDFRNMLLKK